MLLINVVLQLCKGAVEGSQSGAICTDAASDVVCFGQGQPLDSWIGLSSPLLPFVCLSWLPLLYRRGAWCVTLFFTTAETLRDTIGDWHPLESRASCISCSKDRKFSKQGISVETLLLLAPASFLCRAWAQASQNRSRKTEAFGSCLGRTRLFNCVEHSCMSERTLGLAFTRNLFRTILSGLTRNKICTWVSSPHVTLSRSLQLARKLNCCWLERK